MVTQGHDIDIGSGGLRFGLDFLGMAAHGDCHTHVDALNHISYDGLTYNGKPAGQVLTSKGGTSLGIDAIADSGGVVGRGVLLDLPRFRGVTWLEPGEAVTRAELEDCEAAQGVHLDEGDILVYRTGHHRRRLELGPWDNGPDGEGKAGLHVDTVPWMHERGIAAFLPDGDGEAIPSSVEGMAYPLHPLQIVAMGMLTADSLQFEDLARACKEERRFEFLVVGLPLRLQGGTGSPWNPIAIF
jgi:kynurenine formamidase